MNPKVQGYTIRREIGKGGMGMVYQATRECDGSLVALKVLPPHLLNPISAKRFQREGNALKAIRHPNVVRVYEVGSREGLHYIAMEYLDGHPLARLMREQGAALPIERAATIALAVAEALAAIHREGMVHRDLKPGNIMLTTQGEVKLLDFGLVQVEGLTMLTTTGNVVGTPAYMSPEQCNGATLDARSDIYSFAVLVYEMLVGRPPFQSESIYEVLDMQRKAAPALPGTLRKGIPLDLEQILLRCLEKRPEERPADMAEVVAVLARHARRSEPGSVSGAGPTPAAAQPPGGHPRAATAGARASLRTPILIAAAAVALLCCVPLLKPLGIWARRQVHAWQGGPEDGLRNQVSERYRKLAEADAEFDSGSRAEAGGDFQQAFHRYVEAIHQAPERSEYYAALARVADAAGRRSEASALIRSFLRRPGSHDPEYRLESWLRAAEER